MHTLNRVYTVEYLFLVYVRIYLYMFYENDEKRRQQSRYRRTCSLVGRMRGGFEIGIHIILYYIIMDEKVFAIKKKYNRGG